MSICRDIENVIAQMRASHPSVLVEQLKVKFPGADDNDLWFSTCPDSPFEVQLESSTEMCPFLIETDEHNVRVRAHNIGEAISTLTRWLHLLPE